MRKWWVVALAALLYAATLFAADPKETPIATARVTSELRASLTRDYMIDVAVKPHEGDAWTRLAKRVTGDAERWHDLATFNQAKDHLTTDQIVHVPFALLRPELQRQIVATLFSSDSSTAAGWKHIVVGSEIEGESLWRLAEWFTGDGANYAAIRKANPNQGLSTRKGDVIVIPNELLTAAFRTAKRGGVEEENAPSAASEIRQPSHDSPQRQSAHEDVEAASVVETPGLPSLTYERSTSVPYAVYRLQKGEALYSSVAIRFTGRVYSKDVGDVLDRIVKFNGIDDVAKMRVGYAVRIPMDLLLPEYLPPDDPTRIAAEKSKQASAKLAKRARAKNLDGVTVILDAGHGGRDVGAAHDDVYEATYVYDVMCRLKRVLEKRSGATVRVTTRSKRNGYDIAEDDELEPQQDHFVLTTPRYTLDDSVVGVNLRWYLANSIFARAMKSGVPKEKVVFLSIHADSLHPSIRGAMAYIPGAQYVTGSFEKRQDVYLARAEVREHPLVRHSEEESLEAEGLSRDLAESVIDSFDERGLKVHPFNPVRDNVVRDDREWVPAVIRYNLVPTRALLEICNLGNKYDRALLKTQKWREDTAQAIYRGIVSFYTDQAQETSPAVVARAGR
ncbi:MAG TPA: N-acetylmuramoyl-L-alanine amidase [Thermoanaerobaculia bacterium]|nr:N-acetylmuramoyl-L-alanine amidase [Thermoanaerobaculia bacterium]